MVSLVLAPVQSPVSEKNSYVIVKEGVGGGVGVDGVGGNGVGDGVGGVQSEFVMGTACVVWAPVFMHCVVAPGGQGQENSFFP
jgi:hypothetical protein